MKKLLFVFLFVSGIISLNNVNIFGTKNNDTKGNIKMATNSMFIEDIPHQPATDLVNQYSGGQTLGTSTTSSPYSSQTNSLLAQLANQESLLNAQLPLLDTQRGVGYGNIDNSYNQSVNRLGEQRGIAERDYNTGVEDTTRGYQSQRGQVASDTRSRLNSLQQLLGIAGSGNSSASQFAAPYAATREGTQRLQPVQDAYYTNRRDLDTSWEDTQRNYGNTMEDLNNQKYAQGQTLESTIANQRANILAQLADIGVQRATAGGGGVTDALAQQAGRQAEIQSLLSLVAGLGGQFSNAVAPKQNIAFNAPELADYMPGQQSSIGTNIPGGGDVDQLLLPILARKEEERLAGAV